MKRLLVAAVSLLGFTAVSEAQTGCVVPTTAHLRAVDILPNTIFVDSETSTVDSEDIDEGLALWTAECTDPGQLPAIERTSASADSETWSVVTDTYEELGVAPIDPLTGRKRCGLTR